MIKKFLVIGIIAIGASFGAGATTVSGESAQQAAEIICEEDEDIEDSDYLEIAPAFTLKNLADEDISLSDFRGHWVVLDFWGSWCKYCIASFPQMKETYAKYHSKGLEIIGIDCRDTDEAWRQAVDRFQLPWVSLYNPEPKGGPLCAAYDVIGYPTYVLINPEGYVFATFLGESEDLYQIISNLYE